MTNVPDAKNRGLLPEPDAVTRVRAAHAEVLAAYRNGDDDAFADWTIRFDERLIVLCELLLRNEPNGVKSGL